MHPCTDVQFLGIFQFALLVLIFIKDSEMKIF